MRTLRRLHPGPLRVERDWLPGPGVYDIERLRIQSDLLWPAYELLYHRDRRRLERKALEAAGIQGLAALWVDAGQRLPRVGKLTVSSPYVSIQDLEEWTAGLGYPGLVKETGNIRRVITWQRAQMQALATALRPLVHSSCRHLLKPVKENRKPRLA